LAAFTPYKALFHRGTTIAMGGECLRKHAPPAPQLVFTKRRTYQIGYGSSPRFSMFSRMAIHQMKLHRSVISIGMRPAAFYGKIEGSEITIYGTPDNLGRRASRKDAENGR
jgi:hypothetical protein